MTADDMITVVCGDSLIGRRCSDTASFQYTRLQARFVGRQCRDRPVRPAVSLAEPGVPFRFYGRKRFRTCSWAASRASADLSR
jgi:hypothetical protein